MASFKNYYRTIFRTFGYSLTERTSQSAKVIDAAERRLGVRVPRALRDYYLVAGRERRFNRSHNRLLTPRHWRVVKQRLIFLEENQTVLWWGVSVRNPDSDDPPVSQAVNDEPMTWYREHRKCSIFLAVMLHYQAVMDGFRFCSRADAPDETDYRFEKHGWRRYGEVNGVSAYSRPNQVVCLMPPSGLPFQQKWSVFAGAKNKSDLQAIAAEIGLSFK